MSNGGRFHPVPNEGIAPRAWGLDANRISTITIALTVVRTRKEIRIGGNFLWASDATDGGATIKLAFTESEADAGITFKRGSMVAGMRYGKIFVTNAAQAGKTMTLTYAVEAPELRIANPADFFTNVDITKATALDSIADVSLVAAVTTAILAADGTRREAIITNLAGNAQTFRIGDVGAGATNGTPLPPGATIVLTTTAEISGFNPGGAAESVAVTVTRD